MHIGDPGSIGGRVHALCQLEMHGAGLRLHTFRLSCWGLSEPPFYPLPGMCILVSQVSS